MPLIFFILGLGLASGLIIFSCVISGIELHLLWNWKVLGYVLVPSCALAAVGFSYNIHLSRTVTGGSSGYDRSRLLKNLCNSTGRVSTVIGQIISMFALVAVIYDRSDSDRYSQHVVVAVYAIVYGFFLRFAFQVAEDGINVGGVESSHREQDPLFAAQLAGLLLYLGVFYLFVRDMPVGLSATKALLFPLSGAVATYVGCRQWRPGRYSAADLGRAALWMGVVGAGVVVAHCLSNINHPNAISDFLRLGGSSAFGGVVTWLLCQFFFSRKPAGAGHIEGDIDYSELSSAFGGLLALGLIFYVVLMLLIVRN